MVDSDLLSNSKGNFTKYPALKTISGLLKLIAIIASIILIATFGYTVSTVSNENIIWSLVPAFIGSIIATICIYAYGELITLFIDIEQNTRRN